MSAAFDSFNQDLWFFGPISRVDTESKLLGKTPGTFLVRESRTSPGDFVLSVSENNKVSHYIIEVKNEEYCIGELKFRSLPHVIDFYKVHYLDTTTITEPCPKNSLPSPSVPNINQPIMPPGPPMSPPERPSHPTSESSDSLMGLKYVMKYDFESTDDEDLPAQKGEVLTLVQKEEDHWWKMRNKDGKTGLVPQNRMQLWTKPSQPSDIYKQTAQISGPLYARVIQQRIPTPYDKTNLRLEVGDIIKVTSRNTSGQWEGEDIANNKQGSFPFRFVQILQGAELEEVLKTLPKNGPSPPANSH